RVMLMTFLGKKRWAADADPHESPKTMTWPLIGLGALSVVGGAGLLYLGGGIVDWLSPVTGEEHHELPLALPLLIAITLIVVVAGVAVAWLMYGARSVPEEQPAGNVLTVASRKDLYGDAVNEALLMRPGQYLTRSLVYADSKGIDGAVAGVAAGFVRLAE